MTDAQDETNIDMMAEKGRVTWLTSGPDEGPDCGLVLGLGEGASLHMGEFADATLRDAGINPDDFPGIGWWLAVYNSDRFQFIGPVAADTYEARNAFDVIAAAVSGIPQ